MSKKARRNQRSEAARYTSIARSSPAASRVWPDLLYRDPVAARPVTLARRANPHRLVRRLPRVLNRPTMAFNWGPWGLPPITERDPLYERLSAAEAKRVSLTSRNRQLLADCVGRHRRREVLFAKRFTGAGAHARRLHFTNTRC